MVDRRLTGAALLAVAVLMVPSSVLAGKQVKPGPCVVSNGVVVTTIKSKGVTTLYVEGTTGWDNIDCSNAKTSVVIHGRGVATGDIGDTIYGGPKDDDLYAEGDGSARSDYVIGNGGNDTIHAGGPSVTAFAMGDAFNYDAVGGGADTLIATGGYVQFYGGDGNDQIDVSGATHAYVEGGAGSDSITGSPGADSLFGGTGDDTLTDSGSGGEVFNCSDGAADVLNDLDGNGAGGGTGDAEDDTHVGCETVNSNGTAPCTFTAGTTGCVFLNDVVAYTGTTGSGPNSTTFSGSFVFSPITTWDFFTGGTASGSGTWTSSIGTSGTWTAHDETNTQAYYPRFSDANGPTTCALATTRYVGVELSLAGGGLASDAIAELQVRVATTGTNFIWYDGYSASPTGEPLGTHSGLDVSGVTILC